MPATIDDLYRVDGKAELIGGEIVCFPPAGLLPSRLAGRLAMSLDDHARRVGRGFGFGGTLGFEIACLPSGRKSFCPDAGYYAGPLPDNPMHFIVGPPTFAVEVRDEADYGAGAELEMAAKRSDYFAAGTLAVWDVDSLARRIRVYRRASPDGYEEFGPGETANAEPAVLGWEVAVDWVFR